MPRRCLGTDEYSAPSADADTGRQVPGTERSDNERPERQNDGSQWAARRRREKVVGRKRRILGDTLGCLLYAVVHGADLQDAGSAKMVLKNRLNDAPTIQNVFANGG